MTWFWLNVPVGVLFVAAWAGIPLWLVLRRPSEGPEPADIQYRAHAGAAAITSREDQWQC